MGQIVHYLLFNRCCWIALHRVHTNLHSLQQCARMPPPSGLLSQHALHLFPLCSWDRWGKLSHCRGNLHFPRENWSHWRRLHTFISFILMLFFLPVSLKMAFSVEMGPLTCVLWLSFLSPSWFEFSPSLHPDPVISTICIWYSLLKRTCFNSSDLNTSYRQWLPNIYL